MRSAQHDRRGATVKQSVAATQNGLFIECITKSGARSEVVAIVGLPAGIKAGSQQCGIRILHRRRRHKLTVIPNPEIKHQLRINTNIILKKHSEVCAVWIGGSACRAGAGKVLRESRGRILLKGLIARRRYSGNRIESVLPRKKPREEIEDAIAVYIQPRFKRMATHPERNVINNLKPLNRRLARAEIISPNKQEARAGIDLRFRSGAVCRSRLAIFRHLKT